MLTSIEYSKGYCRLSKLIRARTLDEATLRPGVDNETMALAIVRHGLANVKRYGDVQHPLYKAFSHSSLTQRIHMLNLRTGLAVYYPTASS